MAKTKKKNRKMGRTGRLTLTAFVALLLLLCLVMGGATINANIVHVMRAEVFINDLPESFENRTILFASDIDLCALNTPAKAGELFRGLQALSPDMLILGGDYASHSLLEILNNADPSLPGTSRQQRDRSDFFHYICDFNAPMGKYAIASPEDFEVDALASLMMECGVRPVFNDRVCISIGNDVLWLTGISEETANLNSAGRAFSRSDCVIVTAYSPTVIPMMLTSEAADGGQWADLVLCGHTHGGQVRLFDRDILQLNRVEQQYRAGWFIENGIPILTSQGVGCEGVNMRIGTNPEVWLLTLKRN
ncbi:MAG: hypothetical protein IJ124_02730 [Clostridia bacterium]|nr:hypothetical protein [Clostridia bacterium]